MEGLIIKLNIGGAIFTTLLSTLISEKDTFFEKFFGDHFSKEMVDGCYLIDRDAKYFDLILNHMRGKDISRKLEELKESDLFDFVEEVVFYQITSLMPKLPKKGIKMLKELGIE
ncbi:hypothetical protein ABK040_005166 [Willaertia magna]